MNKAVFLDRDGVINDGTAYYTYTKEAFVVNPGVIEGLQKLQKAGYKFIVITNQSGVAKGVYSLDDVKTVHQYMIRQFVENGVVIDGLFVCPHHPSVADCNCRKPKTELFERAIRDFDIDVTKSYMIGDSERDIIAAEKVGVKGIKIERNENILPYCQKIIDENV